MDLKTQNTIVKQRLHYHFAKTDGTWDIPKDMPFMKEFLNEVKHLTELCEGKSVSTGSGQSNIPDVSNRRELYFAFMKEYNSLMGESEHQILREEVEVLLAKYSC